MSAFMSNPPGSEGPQVVEGVPVLSEPPMFPGLAADLQQQLDNGMRAFMANLFG